MVSLLAGCNRSTSAPVSVAAAEPDSARVAAPIDIAGVMRQVGLAYRAEGGAFVSHQPTFSAEVRGGALSLAPVISQSANLDALSEHGLLTLRTSAITRDGAALELQPSAQVATDGHLELRHGAFVEHLRNTEGGVEQSWEFASEPEGSGDLVIRVGVDGLPFAGVTAGGLHFADASGLGFRYGHATWIDADGNRTALESRFVDGQIELRVVSEVVERSRFPAVLDPVISPELDFDESLPEPSFSQAFSPAIASDGTDFLIVWKENREGSLGWDIYGARINASGEYLEPGGILICRASGDQLGPSVAFGDGVYLVVWEDHRGTDGDIYAARVSPSGVVLDPDGFPLSTANYGQTSPAVAFSGGRFLALWEDSRNGDINLHGTRVESDGRVLDVDGFAVSSASGSQVGPAVAATTDGFMAVWEDRRGPRSAIYGSRIDLEAVVADPSGFALTDGTKDARHPAIARGKSALLVAWTEGFGVSSSEVVALRITEQGTPIDPVAQSLFSDGSDIRRPSANFDGTGFLVVWHGAPSRGSGSIHLSRIDEDGTATAAISLTSSMWRDDSPVIASSNTHTLLAWDDSLRWEIKGAFLHEPLGYLPEAQRFRVSHASPSTGRSNVAFGGGNYLVVWSAGLPGSMNVLAARVSPDGTLLDPAGIPICTEDCHAVLTRVATDGSDFLVVWTENFDRADQAIRFARVSGDGTLLDPLPRQLAAGPIHPEELAAAGNASNYLVVWKSLEYSETRLTGRQVRATRLHGSGAAIEPANVALAYEETRSATTYGSVAATCGTEHCLAAWIGDFQDGKGKVVAVARFAAEGTALDPLPIRVPVPEEPHFLAASSGESTYALLWNGFGKRTVHLRGIRLSHEGKPRESSASLLVESVDPSTPAVAFDGSAFVFAYVDDVQAMRVSKLLRSGDVLTVGMPLIAVHSQFPSLASDLDGVALVAYTGAVGLQAWHGTRVRARLVGLNSDPEAISQAVDTMKDVPVTVLLTGRDPDQDRLSYTLQSQPAHGTLSGTPPELVYTPDVGFFGDDSFTFSVSDGRERSAPARVDIEVVRRNRTPIAVSARYRTHHRDPLTFVLEATDEEGDPLTFSLTRVPEQGSLTGEPPSLTYQPEAFFHGTVSLEFVVSDGNITSAPATIHIEVDGTSAVMDAGCGCSSAAPSSPWWFALVAPLLAMRRRPRARS